MGKDSFYDGDTFTFMPSKAQVGTALSQGTVQVGGQRIRLEGIDAPELKQPMGPEAKAALYEALKDRELEVEIIGQDRHGRPLGIVKMPDGRTVQSWLIEQGYAMFDERYHKPINGEDWLSLQKSARENKRGYWGVEGAEAPWDYRRRTSK